jgi:Zn-dependent peptidase ImmA (M78 family)
MDLALLLTQRDKYVPMKAQDCNVRAVIKHAENMAKSLDVSPTSNLRELITKNGGTIHDITFSVYQQFEKVGVLDNSIYVRAQGDFDIMLHADLLSDQVRYTLAHELGHYILHGQPMSFARQKGDSQIEYEAYWFAVGFLMPEELFRKAYKVSNDMAYLHGVFRVPHTLIQNRQLSLDL